MTEKRKVYIGYDHNGKRLTPDNFLEESMKHGIELRLHDFKDLKEDDVWRYENDVRYHIALSEVYKMINENGDDTLGIDAELLDFDSL